jgi:hypothetical protein
VPGSSGSEVVVAWSSWSEVVEGNAVVVGARSLKIEREASGAAASSLTIERKVSVVGSEVVVALCPAADG